MQLSVGLHAQIVVLEEWNLLLRLASCIVSIVERLKSGDKSLHSGQFLVKIFKKA